MLVCLVQACFAQARLSLPINLAVLDADIQLNLPDSEYRVLEFSKGENTIELPVIVFSSEQAMTKGTIILIADLQSQQTTSAHFYKLAKKLPLWGWNTVFVTPKTDYFVLSPKSTTPEQALSTQDANTNDGSDDKASVAVSQQTGLKAIELQQLELGYTQENYTDFMSQLLVQIKQTFLQQPGYQILLVEGKSAAIAIDLLNNEQSPQPNALVLNNPYWPDFASNQSLPNRLAKLQLPVLDLVSFSDNNWSIQTQAKRATQTRVMVKPFYRQREILRGQDKGLAVEHQAKEIVGWTRYLGW